MGRGSGHLVSTGGVPTLRRVESYGGGVPSGARTTLLSSCGHTAGNGGIVPGGVVRSQGGERRDGRSPPLPVTHGVLST